ncbi:hypothetical protein LMG3458_02488 [Achromobacter deleyi]|uniref:N-acetyltransferase domain-containing protein n=1 Tax=Achromobacter deleyi TaxID=1353891 RepID=A0A6S6ZZ64_9BURK|nr:hypothetical protein [Achromobacter deleyi]CAB3697882.1 hypothetical protein LMG3458_02488 [Achromobacter deleyi]
MASFIPASSWNGEQRCQVREAFTRHFEHMTSLGHPFAAHASVDEGCEAIAQGYIKAVIAAEYVIVYDTGNLWYSSALLLFEEMVVRLGDAPGAVSEVPALLDELAGLYGCAGVISGNAIARPGLTRVYGKAGYSPVATRFYKEIPIERSSESPQEGG